MQLALSGALPCAPPRARGVILLRSQCPAIGLWMSRPSAEPNRKGFNPHELHDRVGYPTAAV